MHIYSEILSRETLDEIAGSLGMILHNADSDFSGARRRRISLTLRPVSGAAGEPCRLVKNGRRVYAVSWNGHYAFMRALLAVDPGAEIRSSLAHWSGLADFEKRAPETATRNVGSLVSPELAREACHEPQSIASLTRLALGVAASLRSVGTATATRCAAQSVESRCE